MAGEKKKFLPLNSLLETHKEGYKYKAFAHLLYQILMVWQTKTPMDFYFNLKYFVENMVIVIMNKS